MTSSSPDRNEAQAKLWSMIKKIKVAMMTSWDGEAMHSRPMHGYQEEFEDKLYFFTRHELRQDGRDRAVRSTQPRLCRYRPQHVRLRRGPRTPLQ